jgi:oxaloacetate decarboxylase gamma subunit
MTILDMLGQSSVLTVLGIGVVFAFLIIMIICLTLVHKLVQILKLDVEKSAGANASAGGALASAQQNTVPVSNSAIVAAITAAIRSKKS